MFLEYVVPRRGLLRTLMRRLEPPLGAVYGVHWAHDLPTVLSDAGLTVLEVGSVWWPVVQAIVAAKAHSA